MKFSIFAIFFLVIIQFSSCKGDKIEELNQLSSDETQREFIEENVGQKVDSTSDGLFLNSFSDSALIDIKKDSVELSASVLLSRENSQSKASSGTNKGAQEVERKKTKGRLSFTETTFDFGFIDMDEEIDHTFYFKNRGDGELNISSAEASCGCTTPSYPFIPIKPGEESKIDVHFSGKGRLGSQQAEITIYSDGVEPVKKLYLKGTVVAPIANSAVDTSDQE